MIDVEELDAKFSKALSRTFEAPSIEEARRLRPLIDELLALEAPLAERDLAALRRRHGFAGKRSYLFQAYLALVDAGELAAPESDRALRKTLQIKPCKSWSGVVSVTIFTAAASFSCAHNCAYCPNEPGQPRSYLKGEPGVLRANKHGFDAAEQIWSRMQSLRATGHEPAKVEMILSGGTWSSYPVEYREAFCRDVYYAVTTFWDAPPRRERLSLHEEKALHRDARSRIVGLTIETRPDSVDADEIRRLRVYGVTRVQLGVQHIDDAILDRVSRRCPTARTVAAIADLKRAGFKVDAHFMPNLPGSTPEKDRDMLVHQLFGLRRPVERWHAHVPRSWLDWARGRAKRVAERWERYDLARPDLSFDQAKIYPTEVTPWTDIEKWFRDGTYVPYGERDLMDILIDMHAVVYPWVRLNRIVRDIPDCYTYNARRSNLRQDIQAAMEKENMRCMDIRAREVKDKPWDGSSVLTLREYGASGGTEYFVSAESEDASTLYGFVRLRLDEAKNKPFEELEGAALVRELHVYGSQLFVGDATGAAVQHRGLGRTLLARAERLAADRGYEKIAVIAAEGNARYYEKLGYDVQKNYATKQL